MSGPEERRRAVDLYSATPMTTAQVVEHLGYPTRQCLERWLVKDPRACRPYGEAHHPAGDGDQGDRTGAGRHARKRAAERFGAGVGAVHNWVRTYREGGMAALRPVYGQINVYSVTTKSERYERSYWTRTAAGNGIGGRKAPVPYGS